MKRPYCLAFVKNNLTADHRSLSQRNRRRLCNSVCHCLKKCPVPFIPMYCIIRFSVVFPHNLMSAKCCIAFSQTSTIN